MAFFGLLVNKGVGEQSKKSPVQPDDHFAPAQHLVWLPVFCIDSPQCAPSPWLGLLIWNFIHVHVFVVVVVVLIHHLVRHSSDNWIIFLFTTHLMSHAQYTWSRFYPFCKAKRKILFLARWRLEQVLTRCVHDDGDDGDNDDVDGDGGVDEDDGVDGDDGPNGDFDWPGARPMPWRNHGCSSCSCFVNQWQVKYFNLLCVFEFLHCGRWDIILRLCVSLHSTKWYSLVFLAFFPLYI